MTRTMTTTAVRTYGIDKSHSEVAFQVRHLLTKVRGHFADFDGSIEFDEAQPENSSVDVTIKASSVSTSAPDRDTHLRSADFFDVEKHPELRFTSTSITPRGAESFDVTGNLTIHGVTKVVTLPASYMGKANDPWGNERLGFEAELTINRKDFGLNWNAALETGGFLVGDDVKITLSVQAVGK